MRDFRVGLGETVLLRLGSIDLPCTCWPSVQIDLCDIALSKPYLNMYGIKPEAKSNIIVLKSNCFTKSKARMMEVELVNGERFEMDQFELNLAQSFVKETYLAKHVIEFQNLFLNYMGQPLLFKIIRIEVESTDDLPEKFKETVKITDSFNIPILYEITSSTRIFLSKLREVSEMSGIQQNMSNKIIKFNKVAGLDREIQILKELFIYPFEYANFYKKIGLNFDKINQI